LQNKFLESFRLSPQLTTTSHLKSSQRVFAQPDSAHRSRYAALWAQETRSIGLRKCHHTSHNRIDDGHVSEVHALTQEEIRRRGGRPKSPRLGALNAGFICQLRTLKELYNLQFMLWWLMVGAHRLTFIAAIEGRAPASFVVLSMLARIRAVVNVPAAWVTTAYTLPPVDQAITIADIKKLRTLARTNVFVKRFCDRRLREITQPEEAAAIAAAEAVAFAERSDRVMRDLNEELQAREDEIEPRHAMTVLEKATR
jgi:hypothetical protein